MATPDGRHVANRSRNVAVAVDWAARSVAWTIVRNVASPRLLLASASPARLRTLQAAGIDADVLVSGVDESSVEADGPEALCAVLARMKAQAVADRLRDEIKPEQGDGIEPARSDGIKPVRGDEARQPDSEAGETGLAEEVRDRLVLGCDSVLAFHGEILGKPADPEEAVRRWRRMRGQTGVLYTGHCLIEVTAAGNQGRLAEEAAATTVRFADVTDAEIDAYVATGEPMRVAGAFTIDGIGGPFVEGIDGDPGTVIGLSLPLLRHLLARLDLRVYDLWRPTT